MAEAKIAFRKPRKFQDLNALETAINEYFQDCDNRNVPYTISGLAYTLHTSRRTLLNIQEGGYYPIEFIELINLTKAKILSQLEEGMLSGRYNAAGSIFTLKNNFGYVDKIEQVVEVKDSIADTLEQRRKKVIEAKQVKLIEASKDAS
jgi:hypothetical protein